jgi:hypothetical protein
MNRFERVALGAASGAMILAIAGNAMATITLPPPLSPLPTSNGTGLSSQWQNGAVASDYEELDRALTFITPSSFDLEGVGPVSFSNNLAVLGDFATHATMPYSLQGTPTADGWYLVTRMTGAWAARAAGAYTFAIAADDGYRVTLGGTVILNHPPAQSFRRAATSFVVTEPGLYPIVVEYFNEVEEGAVELSFTPGEVMLDGPNVPVPSSFALVPLSDLYPPGALVETVDGGLVTPEGAAQDNGGSISGESWHGGGCAITNEATSASPGWLATTCAIFGGALARWRRRATKRTSQNEKTSQ